MSTRLGRPIVASTLEGRLKSQACAKKTKASDLADSQAITSLRVANMSANFDEGNRTAFQLGRRGRPIDVLRRTIAGPNAAPCKRISSSRPTRLKEAGTLHSRALVHSERYFLSHVIEAARKSRPGDPLEISSVRAFPAERSLPNLDSSDECAPIANLDRYGSTGF
jgi:hypothetical protein